MALNNGILSIIPLKMKLRKVMMPHSLPKNWKREERLREGIGRKLVQVIYWSPDGKKITTKKELMEELGSEWDAPECLDFKTYEFSLQLNLNLTSI